MLKRLYVDNFRCFVNFDLRLDEMVLLLGGNGSGKTSVFDVLRRLKSFVTGDAKIEDAFPSSDRTRWDRRTRQTFVLEIEDSVGTFVYELRIEYASNGRSVEVGAEKLSLASRPLYEASSGEVRLFRDDEVVSTYALRTDRSGLEGVPYRATTSLLGRFREHLERLVIVALKPSEIGALAAGEHRSLQSDGSNFASWYRYLAQEHQDRVFELIPRLQEVLAGFRIFKLVETGYGQRMLQVGFAAESGQVTYYRFDELSDGQRALIVLYTLLVAGPEYTLFLDEPENFVTLAEIQPWLMELRDACGETVPQAVLISHHPELIDYLASEAIWFARDPEAPTRIEGRPEVDDRSIPLSDQIARGWVP